MVAARSSRPPRTQAIKEGLDIFFGNVTIWGEQAKSYVLPLKHDVVALAEHRMRGEGFDNMVSSARSTGWYDKCAPAKIKNMEASGGTGLFRKSHLQTGELHLESEDSSLSSDFGLAWTLTVIQLHGASLILGVVDLKSGVG